MNDPAASHPGSVSNVLELEGVSKFFPGVIANDKIDFTLKEREIQARFTFQLTVSMNPLVVVGWRCKPESS